jgi:small-conductance mechanosensitive channel
VLAFFAAWLLSRWAGRVAEPLVRRYEARTIDADDSDTVILAGMKRRDTAVSLTTTTLRYAAFGTALVLAVLILTAEKGNVAVLGGSLVVVLIGFAGQRFLTDIIAGFFMFFEGWFSVGDTVKIEPWEVEGVVDEVSLRSTKLRAVNGDTIRVHNSQIAGVRVLPRGVRDFDIEVFVNDEDAGRRLVEDTARLVPTGPLHYIRRPWVAEVQRLDADLVRIKARATVAPGREWLVRDFLVDVIKERAGSDLLVHGPVVIDVADAAVGRYQRSFTPMRPKRPAKAAKR